jgi:hypothetical protein
MKNWNMPPGVSVRDIEGGMCPDEAEDRALERADAEYEKHKDRELWKQEFQPANPQLLAPTETLL